MNIIVVGCGKIGTTILSSLIAEGHNVTAVDNHPAVLAEVSNIYDTIGVCGNATDCDILQEAGVETADILIAVTGSDELNMLSCFLARRMGAKHTIARIRNPEYNARSLGFMKQQLNLSLAINPDLMAAHELFNILKLPSAAKIETFSARNFEMVELRLKPNSILEGMKIADMRSKYKANYLVCAVQRGENAYIPDGNFILHSGDKIGITASPAEVQKLLRDLNVLQKQARNIMILGGSRTAFYLTQRLTAFGNQVTVIEKDKDVCEEFCNNIPKAVIINGDGTGQELLLEEGLLSLDAFLALTGMDEENILMASYAATRHVPKVIAKVNRENLLPLAEQWGLDCSVTPSKIISNVVLRYTRALEASGNSSVETVYKLMDDQVEALEFVANAGLPMLQKPLKDLKLKPNTLIAGIIRERRPIIPDGNDMILAGDKVVVLTLNTALRELTDILR